MANIHTFVVRTAVKAGMYTLPTREHFLKGIGETDCALPQPPQSSPSCSHLCTDILQNKRPTVQL